MDCELCKDGIGYPGDINGIPVIICIKCLRRGELTKTGNLRQKMETWMWKRRTLRKLGASFNDRLGCRTKWIMARREFQASEEEKKKRLDVRFIQTNQEALNALIMRVEKGQQ